MQIVQRDNLAHITLDRAADETLVFDWANDAGEAIDLSAMTVRVAVKGAPAMSFEPTIDVDDQTKRVLTFDQSFTAMLGGRAREFMIEAVYADGNIDVITRGTLTATGWVS